MDPNAIQEFRERLRQLLTDVPGYLRDRDAPTAEAGAEVGAGRALTALRQARNFCPTYRY